MMLVGAPGIKECLGACCKAAAGNEGGRPLGLDALSGETLQRSLQSPQALG